MKILHLNDDYSPAGGVQQYLLSVCRLLQDDGHQNIVAYRVDSPHTMREAAYHVPRAADLASLIDQEQPDVAYVHHVHAPEHVTAVARRLPALGYVHGFAAVCPGLAKHFRRGDGICAYPFGWRCFPLHYLRRCSAARHPRTVLRRIQETAQLKAAYAALPRLLVASTYMRALLLQNGFAASQVAVLPPHFVQEEDIPPYAPPTEPHTILFAGRLEMEKGVPYLLRALVHMPAHLQLVVAGDGTLRPFYERLAARLGLSARVTFMGWLPAAALQACYRRCAVLALPTIMPEAFGKVGLEALAHGRPVVAFAVGGIPDWLDNAQSGLLVSPGDWRQLAAALTTLLAHPDDQAALARQQRVRCRYPAAAHLDALLQAFTDVLRADA